MIPLADRKKMVDVHHPKPSISKQCSMLGLARSSYYHKPKPVSEQDLQIMHTMDRMYL